MKPPRLDTHRFWSLVLKTSDCWLWAGARQPDGYGHYGGQMAHRISYQIHYGKIPDGMQVAHRCDVRYCVRPDHLFLATPAQNTADMIIKGRGRNGFRGYNRRAVVRRGSGHHRAKLTEKDILWIRHWYATGQATQRALAREFGVNQTTIRKIVLGMIWQHVTDGQPVTILPTSGAAPAACSAAR